MLSREGMLLFERNLASTGDAYHVADSNIPLQLDLQTVSDNVYFNLSNKPIDIGTVSILLYSVIKTMPSTVLFYLSYSLFK